MTTTFDAALTEYIAAAHDEHAVIQSRRAMGLPACADPGADLEQDRATSRMRNAHNVLRLTIVKDEMRAAHQTTTGE